MKRIFSLLIAAALLSAVSPAAIFAEESAAPSAVLMEAESGAVLYESGAYEPRPTGTLAKIMTVLIAAEAIEKGALSLDSRITARESVRGVGGAVVWLEPGDSLTLDEIIRSIIIGNANDASIALADAMCGSEEAFAAEMNRKAAELGANDTFFLNCTGIDAEGQHTTAYDTALICRELIRHEWLYDYMTLRLDYVKDGAVELVSRNGLIGRFNGLIGIKEGYSASAGSCLAAAAERGGSRYISVVMGEADSDSAESACRQLLEKGFSEFTAAVPDIPDELFEPIVVRNGVKYATYAVIADMRTVVVPRGSFGSIESEVIMAHEVPAPVARGQVVGMVYFRLDGEILFESEIVAGEDVRRFGFADAVMRLLSEMLKI